MVLLFFQSFCVAAGAAWDAFMLCCLCRPPSAPSMSAHHRKALRTESLRKIVGQVSPRSVTPEAASPLVVDQVVDDDDDFEDMSAAKRMFLEVCVCDYCCCCCW